MIERLQAFKASDGKVFADLESVQRHELTVLLTPGGMATLGTATSESVDKVVASILANKDKVVDILTTSLRSKARARSVNGGKKNRTTKAATAQPAVIGRADGATER